LNNTAKTIVRPLVDPLRTPVSWAFQHGVLPSYLRKFFPWWWVLEPFTLYGKEWKCRWYPTEFDDVGHEVFWSGFRKWEAETVPVMMDHIRRSKCFIDVGANCGIYTVLAAVINPNLRVVAIEPVPKVCAALTRNVIQNNLGPRVTILNVAASDANGTVDFHEAENTGMSSLAPNGYRSQAGKVIQVQCRTLDSIIAQLSIEPDFVKIDVEGFEDVVLSGASRLLELRPRIVLEANPDGPCGRMTEMLTRSRYALHLITDNGPERRDAIIPVAEYRNWLCLPSGC